MSQLPIPLKIFFDKHFVAIKFTSAHPQHIRRSKFWPCLMEEFMVPHCSLSCDMPFCINRVSTTHTLSDPPVETRGGAGDSKERTYRAGAPGRQEFLGETVLVAGYYIRKNQIKAKQNFVLSERLIFHDTINYYLTFYQSTDTFLVLGTDLAYFLFVG